MSGPRVREGTIAKIYDKHLKKMQTATAKIDNSAPRLPVSVYVKDASFYADIARLRNMDQLNREMLKRINVVYRTKGRVDCELERYNRQKTIFSYKLAALEKQRKKNVKFLEKLDLKFMKSQYNQTDSLKHWKKMLKVMRFTAKYPEFYDKKPSHLDTWSPCPKNVPSNPSSHQVCFFDLKIGDLPSTCRLEIEVYSDVVPATAANFVALCQGFGNLSYKESLFHRIVPGLLCIGGDIVNHSGTGGMSIYGPSFPDENFTLQHNGPGVVAMYSSQPDNNNSQFLITFKKLSTLNGEYVVIGRVKSNYNVLRMGRVDCELERYNRQKTIFSYKLAALEKQRKKNVKFLEKLDLKFMKSQYNQTDSLKHWKKMLKVMRFTAKYPEFYDKKPSHLDTWSPCPKNVPSNPSSHQVCFFDLKIGDLPSTCRLEIEVYSDVVPATAANFVALCQGFGNLSYKESLFHRIVPGLLCIGGDIVNHSGTGGMSIYGPSFPDENFTLQHNGPGVVAMYSSQPDNNNSQFLITFKKLSTLNGEYVVIGRVKSNYNVLRMIESCGTKGGKPLQTVEFVNCGVYGELKRETLPPQIELQIDTEES